VTMLDAIEINSGSAMAHVTLGIVGKILRWYAARVDDYAPPLVRGMGRYQVGEQARARVLNDHELRAVWKATANGGPFERLVRFLLLTGARRNEAAGLRWDEVKDGVWTLPAIRNKVGVELARPLSKAAQAIIDQSPRFDGCPYVFSRVGSGAITRLSPSKRQLGETSGVTDLWRHDLRRTARSLMSRAGVPSDHAERALGHVLGGVKAVYDRHRYIDEMAVAYEKLASLIQRIVDPQPNVVAITARG
jgi:integrase